MKNIKLGLDEGQKFFMLPVDIFMKCKYIK